MIIQTEVTEEQTKAFASYEENPTGIIEQAIANWLQHAWDEKARRRIDALVDELDPQGRNPKKMADEQKKELLLSVKVPTRAERDKR